MASDGAPDATAASFPTAAAVPFPFASPYDVQRDLMAALLDALRLRDRRRDRDRDRDDRGEGGRAPIIMLESPTGTGKSLSLACASMAWLRHRERADLDELLPPPAVEGGAVKGEKNLREERSSRKAAENEHGKNTGRNKFGAPARLLRTWPGPRPRPPWTQPRARP